MLTALVILGTGEPENPNVPVQFGIFPIPGEFQYRRLGNRLVGTRDDVFRTISGGQQADRTY